MTIEGIKTKVTTIKQDIESSKITLSEAIKQLELIDYDFTRLYNALYTTYNINLYIN